MPGSRVERLSIRSGELIKTSADLVRDSEAILERSRELREHARQLKAGARWNISAKRLVGDLSVT